MPKDRHHDGKPDENRIEPMTRPAATIKPQTATGTGLASVARTDVSMAAIAPTSRSNSNGNDTTTVESTITAKTKPTALPTRIRVQP